MPKAIEASNLKRRLSERGELALIDVREPGQFGEGHPFFAVPLPYSRFELGLPTLVPNPGVCLILCDAGDGVAERAAARAEALGYRQVEVLAGGVGAWSEAGYTLYAGVNVPSKTFGELVEQERHTPRLSARELAAMRAAKDDFVIVDGRPFSEYRKMNIPGGICCPNGELALRIHAIAPDRKTKVIVNCAGRTRSIVGAQILLDFGIANPVYALENGTQGWFLAGLELEHGANRRYRDSHAADLEALRQRARRLAARHAVAWLDAASAQAWLHDSSRTSYFFDVRSPEEFAADQLPGFLNAPGGQLLQATDQWVGVKGARLVLIDTEEVRAPVIAGWLQQLGHEAAVIEGGIAAARTFDWRRSPAATIAGSPPPLLPLAEAAETLRQGRLQLIDLRPSMSYRQGHLAGASWSVRPRLAAAVADTSKTIALIADDPAIAQLAAIDLAELGCGDVRLLAAAPWPGLAIAATPEAPADRDAIDYLFFTAKRHEGTAEAAEAARRYLAWEVGLIDQLDAQERGAFRIGPGATPTR
jgi:rhodanese-related sulfurtransferase